VSGWAALFLARATQNVPVRFVSDLLRSEKDSQPECDKVILTADLSSSKPLNHQPAPACGAGKRKNENIFTC
jgi:hypothetical protein